jgi:5-deoxy-glucuronate isomerase
MQSCGRIRKTIRTGWNQIIDGELDNMDMGVLQLAPGETYSLQTQDREYAIVLIQGECQAELPGAQTAWLGPRADPFRDMPHGIFISREETVGFLARAESLLGIASSPAQQKLANSIITPDRVDAGIRGADNWTREVRKICWSDNTQGNLLLASETITPSGNWSTVPPHRHQYDVPGEEAQYEEIYFFRFSHPHGYGLTWQFDDEGGMDQAFSLKTNDAVYHNVGYHPVVCSPGTTLYQLTFMAGPRRISKARIHLDYQYILDEKAMENQYTPS